MNPSHHASLPSNGQEGTASTPGHHEETISLSRQLLMPAAAAFASVTGSASIANNPSTASLPDQSAPTRHSPQSYATQPSLTAPSAASASPQAVPISPSTTAARSVRHGQSSACVVVREIHRRIGDQWSLLTLFLLREGPLRFNAIKAGVEGISQKMLSSTLKSLERDGLVRRTVHPCSPPAVDYGLTDLGSGLLDQILQLSGWVQANLESLEASRSTFDARQAAPAHQDGTESSSQLLSPTNMSPSC